MRKITVTEDQIEHVVNSMDADPDAIHRSYSGRGMYGDTCFGYSGGQKTLFVATLAEALIGDSEDIGDLLEMIGDIGEGKTDNLSYDTILYWPWITVER